MYSDPVFAVFAFLVEGAAEGGFIARALGHSNHTEAEAFDELRLQVGAQDKGI